MPSICWVVHVHFRYLQVTYQQYDGSIVSYYLVFSIITSVRILISVLVVYSLCLRCVLKSYFILTAHPSSPQRVLGPLSSGNTANVSPDFRTHAHHEQSQALGCGHSLALFEGLWSRQEEVLPQSPDLQRLYRPDKDRNYNISVLRLHL
jgi:hypothetical protein